MIRIRSPIRSAAFLRQYNDLRIIGMRRSVICTREEEIPYQWQYSGTDAISVNVVAQSAN